MYSFWEIIIKKERLSFLDKVLVLFITLLLDKDDYINSSQKILGRIVTFLLDKGDYINSSQKS